MNNNYPPNPNDQERERPPYGAPQPPGPRPPLVGLGGWLTVFQIYMYWSLFIALVSIPTYIAVLFLAANEDALPEEVRSVLSLYGDNLQALSVYELIVAIIQFVLLVLMMVLLYTRKKSFPRLAKMYLILSLAFAVIAFFVVPPTSGMVASMIWGAVLTLAWNMYFNRSVRVKNTFIR
ncbi:DUF2569 family protein [Paenibacillus bovis]|uniref:DUF2569 domain-containing protein n=1 Tax=Paenibacillus bovis TaxID=1616788 RepID=A0A172ZKN3_9BACL|nr:DUF2569 family protein [Paenibacillus bovis]ANF97972.1 hypothetical protein AR543_19400 [Paenibacillus bovis]